MSPLSPVTYYLRHKGSALLQIALIGLATIGLFILVGVLEAVPMRANVNYLAKLSRVSPTTGALDPAVVSQIQTHPDVARTIPDNGLRILLPTLIGLDSQQLLGVSPEDAQFLIEHCGMRLREGRMFEPRGNEILLSEEVVRALDLELGDEIARSIDPLYYEGVPTPLVLVGILESDPSVDTGPNVRLGFVSASFLDSHELYAPRVTSLLVIARPGRKAAVDGFLEATVASRYTEVETFAEIAALSRAGRIGVYVIFGVVNSVVAVVVAFVVGIINQIAISARLGEFGLLHALGHQKERLTRRLTLETAIVAGIGCLVGLGFALAIMAWLKHGPFYELGMELSLFSPAPFCFVLPIPLVVVVLSSLSVKRILARLDAVAIVERGKLSAEEPRRDWSAKRSSIKPLSSLTFYLRHRRRGALMVIATVLMVLGISFPVFLLSATASALRPDGEYLRRVSEVCARNDSGLAPGVVGQIRSHPTVARTVQAVPLSIQMVVPPGSETGVNIYGVSEADLPILLELYGLRVEEGRLPSPRSNEILISAPVATNRDLHLGDVVGGEAERAGPFVVDNLPTEMVVAGILSPDRPWIGFASYEYLRNHELTASRGTCLLVVPQQGQKQTLDRWLEENVASAQTAVATLDSREREYEELSRSLVSTFALLEFMIAAIAAIALATLNHIFFNQRREEFGVLHAIGRSRMWLVLRTMREMSSVVSIAWAAGAVLCGIGLILMQMLLYTPRGLSLDFLDLTPWLFTLPIPLAVVLASGGTIARALHKLDPVAVIERR